jgi:hypothetical protein
LQNNPEQKPAVGRIVHYVTPEGEHRPAIITGFSRKFIGAGIPPLGEVFPNLYVFFEPEDGLLPFRKCVRHDEPATPASWHWPERVE